MKRSHLVGKIARSVASLGVFCAIFVTGALPQSAIAQAAKGKGQNQQAAPVSGNATPSERSNADSNVGTVPLARAYQISEQAVQMVQRGQGAAAITMLDQVAQSFRQNLGARHPDTITAIFNQAFVLKQIGRFLDAEPLYAELLRARRATLGPRDPITLVAMSEYGTILQILGRSSEAEPIFSELSALGRDVLGEGDENALTFRANHARVLMAMGRAEEAEPILSGVLQLMRVTLGERSLNTLAAMNSYAAVLEAQGRFAQAEPLHREVLGLRREVLGARHPDTVESVNNYAVVLMRLGRLREAEPEMAEALRLSRDVLGERNLTSILAVGNYGAVLDRLGRLDEAERYYREALALQRSVLGERHPSTLLSINNVGTVLVNLKRWQDAAPVFARGLRLFRDELGTDHPNTQLLMANYISTQLASGQPQEALALARELTGIRRSRAAQLTEMGVRGSNQRNRELAGRQGSEGLFVDTLWVNTLSPNADRNGLSSEAFTALQLASAGSTSRAVREAAAGRFAAGQGLQRIVRERQALVAQWSALETSLVESEVGGVATAQTRSDLREGLSAIEARLADIDRRLANEAPKYFAILGQQAVELEELRAALDTDEAILFLVPTKNGTHSMAVTDDGISWSWNPMGEAELAGVVADFRSGLEISGDQEYLPLFDLAQSYSLYRDFVVPIEDGLEGKSRVYVVADGALSRLPLGTLTTSAPEGDAFTDDAQTLRNADWLADRYALVQLPSLQSLVFIRSYGIEGASQDETAFAGFGAPVLEGEATLRGARSATLAPVDAARLTGALRGTSGLPLMNPDALRTLAALPGTRGELEQVRDALDAPGNALYLGEQMTESAIRDANLSGVRILHLATHGFTSEESGDAAEPGLVFTPPGEARPDDDGYLAASEVVALNLASARWVILSACNTASPSGAPGETGLSGLAQAFFYAGAESLLVSHWPVFDAVAPALTVEALKRSQAGQPRAEALQAAMRTIRNDPALDAAHPAVWAPFTLVGEGR